jgi:hypothetical protein
MFPNMFLNHIKNTGLKIPSDLENYNPEEYIQYHIFMLLHLGVPIDVFSLKYNAEIIAKLSDEESKTITLEQLIEKGFNYVGESNYMV